MLSLCSISGRSLPFIIIIIIIFRINRLSNRQQSWKLILFHVETYHQLGGEHAGVELEDGTTKPQAVCNQADLLDNIVILARIHPDVLHRVLKVTEDLRQWQCTHLCIQPLVVEQDIVIKILENIAFHSKFSAYHCILL